MDIVKVFGSNLKKYDALDIETYKLFLEGNTND